MDKAGRIRAAAGSQPPSRPPAVHPHASRPTLRMPFDQLRALVVALIEPAPALPPAASGEIPIDLDIEIDLELDVDVEFEAQPTTCTLSKPRVATLDALIAALPRR